MRSLGGGACSGSGCRGRLTVRAYDDEMGERRLHGELHGMQKKVSRADSWWWSPGTIAAAIRRPPSVRWAIGVNGNRNLFLDVLARGFDLDVVLLAGRYTLLEHDAAGTNCFPQWRDSGEHQFVIGGVLIIRENNSRPETRGGFSDAFQLRARHPQPLSLNACAESTRFWRPLRGCRWAAGSSAISIGAIRKVGRAVIPGVGHAIRESRKPLGNGTVYQYQESSGGSLKDDGLKSGATPPHAPSRGLQAMPAGLMPMFQLVGSNSGGGTTAGLTTRRMTTAPIRRFRTCRCEKPLLLECCEIIEGAVLIQAARGHRPETDYLLGHLPRVCLGVGRGGFGWISDAGKMSVDQIRARPRDASENLVRHPGRCLQGHCRPASGYWIHVGSLARWRPWNATGLVFDALIRPLHLGRNFARSLPLIRNLAIVIDQRPPSPPSVRNWINSGSRRCGAFLALIKCHMQDFGGPWMTELAPGAE